MQPKGEFGSVQPIKWTPKDYQLKGVKWLLSHAGAGLFLDPGLGKTSITLAALKILRAEGDLRNGALVIAPLRPIYNVWDRENPESETSKWLDFNDLKVEVLHGDDKDKALRKKADIYLINPDGLSWLFSKVKVGHFDILVVDESTMFKHANTLRFKLLREYLPHFKRRWILTGTPSPNGLIDLFGQIYIIDLGNAIGRYITHYRRTFFQPTGYGGYTWMPQENAEERIYRRIEPLVLRMSEKDYLKLPPLIGALVNSKQPSLIKIQLPPRAMQKYLQLEDLFFLELEEGSVTAVNAAVKSMKLRQVANGGIYLDKGSEEAAGGYSSRANRKWSLVHDAKTEAVVELLDDLDGRASVIAYEFNHDIARLRMHKRLKNIPAIGEGSLRDDTLLANDWNNGKLQELLVNPASFSRGSNMQRGGDALIFHSLIYNFEYYDQLIRRFWRQGRKRPFYVHHIFAEHTIDSAMVSSINRKNKVQKGLLDALRQYSFRRPSRIGQKLM
jgi:SNF2 family DNA or RNA helicase